MEQNRCYGCMRPRTEGRFCAYCGHDSQRPNAPHQLPAGTRLKGHYLIGKVLGQGGAGITYLGWDLYQNIPVAVKEYYPAGMVKREAGKSLSVIKREGSFGTAFENVRNSFLQEAHGLAMLSNVLEVVQVRDFFQENETAYTVMEYVRGTTLKEYISKHGPMSAADALKMIKPAMEGLQKLHSAHMLHRDISPDNIMILGDGRIKLIDFGFARDIVHEQTVLSTQVILESPFAPIEQQSHNRGNLGAWTDIYALCGTLYFCMTGCLPPNVSRRMQDHRGIGWENIPGLTDQQVRALNRGSALFPQDRIQQMDILINLLYSPDAAQPEHNPVTVPLKQEYPQPSADHMADAEEPLAVTIPLGINKVTPAPKHFPDLENMKTLPLDRSGVPENISFTAPVDYDQSANHPGHAPEAIPVTMPLVSQQMQQPVYADNQPTQPMQAPEKKKAKPAIFIILVLILVALVGCYFAVHIWEDPTCTTPRTCMLCGREEGESLGHDWNQATCTEPKTCDRCGETCGKAKGHSLEAATCVDAATCSVCGETEGKPLGHSMQDATCTRGEICSVCGVEKGEPVGHNLTEATCTAAAKCLTCGDQIGNPLGHSWTAATYTKPKTCTRCGKTEGNVKGYIASVSGDFEEFHQGSSDTYALVFDSSLNGCKSFTLNFKPEFNYNSYVDEWKLYYRNGQGKWTAYQSFFLDGETTSVVFKFDPSVTVSAVAVIPAKRGNYSYSFNLWVTDAYTAG